MSDTDRRKVDTLEKYAKICGYYDQIAESGIENVILITYEESEKLQAERVRRQQLLAQEKAKKL